MLRTIMHWYWLVWFLVLFGVPELVAIVTDRFDTLSNTVWTWFDVLPGQTLWQWSIAHLVLAFFMGWLTLHLVFRVFTTLRG